MREQWFPLTVMSKNSKVSFSGSDQEEMLLSNKKLMPKNWIWQKKSIIYKYNDYGHRNDFDFKSINPKDYTAIIGCSHIEGTGVINNWTIPYLYSNISGQPTYNLGCGGMDNEILFTNAVWAKQVGFKNIIVCWTYPERNFLFKKNGGINIFQGTDVSDQRYTKYFKIDYMVDNPHWEERLTLYEHILQADNVHTFRFFDNKGNEHKVVFSGPDSTWMKYHVQDLKILEDAKNRIELLNDLYARDLNIFKYKGVTQFSAHFGPGVNRQIANHIHNAIKNG